MKRHTLKKHDRLKSKKLLDALFKTGETFTQGPLRVFYRFHEEPVDADLQVVVSVSKRNFKKAVDRNHIKRILREGYRLNCEILKKELINHPENLSVGFFYRSSEIPVFKEVNDKIILSLQRLLQQIKREE
jgi:ribonuclease P protein component